MNLKNNKILITGASSGIGNELAKRFCQLDNQIIAVGRNIARLEELQKLDKRIITYPCDISDSLQLNKLIVFLKKEHQDLNVLINNAGIQYNETFLDATYSSKKIEHEINTNFIAPTKLIFSLIPILDNNANAAIVNVSSGLGLVPKAKSAIYCGTKAALHIFSKSLRYQLDHIKVFEVIPPLVDTEMTKGRGENKISAQKLVDEFLKGFQKNKYEVNIQKVKLLKLINRISPKMADRIMKG